MAHRFRCQSCGTSYPFNEKLVGKRVKCKKCGNAFTATAPPTSASPAMPAVAVPVEAVPVVAVPVVDDLTSNNEQDDPPGASLPPKETGISPAAQKSPLLPASRAGAARRKTAAFKMTEKESNVLYTGIGLFVVGVLMMFGIQLRSRAGRISDRLSGGADSASDPTLPVVGLFMAVAGVGCTCFALRRKLQVACPVGAGMLIVLGAIFAFSPLNSFRAPAAPQVASPPAQQAPSPTAPAHSTGPGAPAGPGFTAESEQGVVTPPVATETPRLAGQGAVLDLFQQLDPQRDAVAGEWTMNRSSIESPGGRSILAFPVKPSMNYRWTIVIERLKGEAGINLALPVANRQTMVVLEGFGSTKASGLNPLSGRTADRNQTTRRGPIFRAGAPTMIVCTVRGASIHVACDGKEIINWSGSPEQLSLDRRYWSHVPPDRLAVTIYESNVLWRVSESWLEDLPFE